MSGWKTVKLADVVERARTWNPSRSAPDQTLTYVDLGALDQDLKQIIGARELMGSEAPSRARQLVASGDVLVSTVRPNLNGVARVPQALDRATASTGFCVLRARSTVLDGGYLFNWVKAPGFVTDMVRARQLGQATRPSPIASSWSRDFHSPRSPSSGGSPRFWTDRRQFGPNVVPLSPNSTL